MNNNLWQHCLERLAHEIPNQQFNTWIRPLHCIQEAGRLRLMAPNAFVLDWVRKHYLDRLHTYVSDLGHGDSIGISLEIGSAPRATAAVPAQAENNDISVQAQATQPTPQPANDKAAPVKANTNRSFTFESFVEG